jgi:hypothetical protein
MSSGSAVLVGIGSLTIGTTYHSIVEIDVSKGVGIY